MKSILAPASAMLVAILMLSVSASLSLASPLTDLQHLLDNAGFDTGGKAGTWDDNTSKALAAFAAHYDMRVPTSTQPPDEAALGAILTDAIAKLDADHLAYPSGKLPQTFYVGTGSQVLSNIHNWAEKAAVLRDGKRAYVPIKRYFETTDEDIATFKAAGVTVMRMQFTVEGGLFWKECDYQSSPEYQVSNACYDKAYKTASKSKWRDQTSALADIANNPVVALLADNVARLNAAGIHVIVAPNDFFWGGTASSTAGGISDPLLHVYLAKDTKFQAFYATWVGAVVAELRRRNIANFSVQAINEPRWCSGKGATPNPQGLKDWTRVERSIFDQVRQAAPGISLVSSAICTSANQWLSENRPYSDIKYLMPIHADLDNVTYTLHLRDPRLLTMGNTSFQLKLGTLVHYPYQPIPDAVSLSDNTSYQIRMYNKQKADASYFEKRFSDLQAFADDRNIHLLISEFDVMKPNFGITPEDRFALVRDVFADAKEHDVSMIYYSIVDQPGLSSCPHDLSVPDHRFDPDLVRLIALGNGVPGATDDATLTPLQTSCGPMPSIETVEEFSHTGAKDTDFDSVFTSQAGDRPRFHFNMRGQYDAANQTITSMFFMFHSPVSTKAAAALQKKCNSRIDVWPQDGSSHLQIEIGRNDKAYTLDGVACIAANAPEDVASQVTFLARRFKELASGMVNFGSIDTVTNDGLKSWITAVANGDVTFAGVDELRPAPSINTIETFTHSAAGDAQFDGVFDIVAVDRPEFQVNIRGQYDAQRETVTRISFMFLSPVPTKAANSLGKKCNVGIEVWDDGSSHLEIELRRTEKTYTFNGVACIVANAPKGVAAHVKFVAKRFRELAMEMVKFETIDTVINDGLRSWIKGVASGDVTFVSIDELRPKFSTDTVEDDAYSTGRATAVDSIFQTHINGAKAGQDRVLFNIRGSYIASSANFYDVRLTIIDPPMDKDMPKGLLECSAPAKADFFSDSQHLVLVISPEANQMAPVDAQCAINAAPPEVGYLGKYLLDNFRTIASDMVESGHASSIKNDYLKAWIGDVASGKVIIAGAN